MTQLSSAKSTTSYRNDYQNQWKQRVCEPCDIIMAIAVKVWINVKLLVNCSGKLRTKKMLKDWKAAEMDRHTPHKAVYYV